MKPDPIPDPDSPKDMAEGLEILAKWFDVQFRDSGTGNDQVQQDLRRWAKEYRELVKKVK